MALYARIDKKQADALITTWPAHSWHKRSLDFLLNQKANKHHIPKIPLNPGLLESVKQYGYVSPFLVIDTWYPICGGQRLRVASELKYRARKETMVDVCRFEKPVWQQLYYWHNKEEGAKAVQMFFQMCEVVFKSMYMGDADPAGKPLLQFEEEGNQLHWPVRDGGKMKMADSLVPQKGLVNPGQGLNLNLNAPDPGLQQFKKKMVLPIVSPK